MSVRRATRIFGTLLAIAGAGLMVWVVVVWRWQDPFTALYTTWRQHQLADSYDRRATEFESRRVRPKPDATLAATVETIRREARRYRLESRRGQAIGRLRVPRLGLDMVVVDGTDDASLKKGPGLDRRTYMPGEGQLVYIAGHRTTYLAPFAHIERLRRGDLVMLEVPYGTFRYRVYTHRIVAADDLSVLRSHGREVVELQACHPRFFASQRYIAYARLVRVEPAGARPFVPPQTAAAAAPLASRHG